MFICPSSLSQISERLGISESLFSEIFAHITIQGQALTIVCWTELHSTSESEHTNHNFLDILQGKIRYYILQLLPPRIYHPNKEYQAALNGHGKHFFNIFSHSKTWISSP